MIRHEQWQGGADDGHDCARIDLSRAMGAGLVTPNFPAADESSKGMHEKHEKKGKAAETIPELKECEDIKAGTQDTRARKAARKDCEASKRLGAGTGTSSGTGSGKMSSESGT